jgi:hypothetical protein
MRSTTQAQRDALAGADRKEFVRLRIADHEDTLVDWTDWLLSWSVEHSSDVFIPDADFVLALQHDGDTIAPLMFSANPPIAEGRRVVFEVAVVPIAEDVQESDWVPLFRGRVDDTMWPGDSLTLPCRGPGRRLHEAWIETESVRGSESGVPVQELMQDLLDDVLGENEVVLAVEGDPDWGIVEYTQSRERLDEALRALSDTQGWELAWLWDDSGDDWTLTYRQPDDNPSVMHTFGPDDYYDVTQAERTSMGRRSVVIIQYSDTSEVVVEDTEAIADPGIGRRPIFIDAVEDLQINSEARATAWGQGILRDVSQPAFIQTVENSLFWPVEVGDFYRWLPNAKHYSTAQDMAVTSYRHEGDNSDQPYTTTIGLRGKPSGGSQRWYRRAVVDRGARDVRRRIRSADIDFDIEPPQPYGSVVVEVVNAAPGEASAQLIGNQSVQSWKFAVSLGAVNPPSASSVRSETAINGQVLTRSDLGTIATPDPGQRVWVSALAYSEEDGGGDESPLLTGYERWGVLSNGIPSAAVVADKMTRQARSWTGDIEFQATASNAISWSSATIRFADGSTQSVNSGSATFATAGPRYIYLSDGSSTLGVTTDPAVPLSVESRVLLAVAKRASDGSSEAFIVPAVGALGGGMNINADNIAANSITAAKISVVSLAAISADLGTVTAGELSAAVVVASSTFTASDARFEGRVWLAANNPTTVVPISPFSDPTLLGKDGMTRYNTSGDRVGLLGFDTSVNGRFRAIGTSIGTGTPASSPAEYMAVNFNGALRYIPLHD